MAIEARFKQIIETVEAAATVHSRKTLIVKTNLSFHQCDVSYHVRSFVRLRAIISLNRGVFVTFPVTVLLRDRSELFLLLENDV